MSRNILYILTEQTAAFGTKGIAKISSRDETVSFNLQDSLSRRSISAQLEAINNRPFPMTHESGVKHSKSKRPTFSTSVF